ncbi:MAG: hypothetical protein OXI77_02630 [Chloroflexota bacterium]|nr:hypothetical protein [Chloroflexota bacterium]MDE2908880.1 hypothetical protein [Chloroflexota bacterium]
MSITTGYMDDDEDPFIYFNKAERKRLPVSDEALNILISVAKQCYRVLHPIKSGMSVQDCWTQFVRSNYCAFLVVQRIDRVGNGDLAALYTKFDIPHLEDTLPALVTAYEQCRSIWTNTDFDDVIEVHAVLDDIGDKMYPDCFDRDVYQQLNDFFADFLSGGEFS